MASTGPSGGSTASLVRRIRNVCDAAASELLAKAPEPSSASPASPVDQAFRAVLQRFQQAAGETTLDEARARGVDAVCQRIEQLEEKRARLRSLVAQYESEERGWRAVHEQLEDPEALNQPLPSFEDALATLSPEERDFLGDNAAKRLVRSASQTQLALELQLDQLMMAAKNFERVRSRADKSLEATAKAINERAFAHMPHVDDPRAIIRGMLGRPAPAVAPGCSSVIA